MGAPMALTGAGAVREGLSRPSGKLLVLINLGLLAGVIAHDWSVYSDVLHRAKLALDEAGISIPYPQRDVHVHEANAGS